MSKVKAIEKRVTNRKRETGAGRRRATSSGEDEFSLANLNGFPSDSLRFKRGNSVPKLIST